MLSKDISKYCFYNKRGFTLTELVMVIVIISILAAVAVPKFINLRTDANQAACEGTANVLMSAIATYYANSALNDETACMPSELTFEVMSYYNPSIGVLDMESACTVL